MPPQHVTGIALLFLLLETPVKNHNYTDEEIYILIKTATI
jgi:putative effector of murein hydrolase LrgA (UPF0299 family)